jgi:hypothetical protein
VTRAPGTALAQTHRMSIASAVRFALVSLVAMTAGPGCATETSYPAGAPPLTSGATGGGSGGSGACSTADVAKVFAAHCTGGACHDADRPERGLDLASSGLEARLVDAPSQGCSGHVLVSPGRAASSYLLDKLQGDASCGAPMPLGKASLDATAINCIADWIDSLGGNSNSGGGSGDGTGTGMGGGGGPPQGGW